MNNNNDNDDTIDKESICNRCIENNCIECEVPGYTPEDCKECSKELDGIEYTRDFIWKDNMWKCEHCGGAC